jgi:hypothetical protein
MLSANPRGAIYGNIVATAVISAAAHAEPNIILAETVATLLIFWLAHVYAEVLAHRLHEAKLDLRGVPTIMVRELSMLVAPALSFLFLVSVRWSTRRET